MNTLKAISLTIVRLAREAWLIPQSFFMALTTRREQSERKAREAERLDRIRDPEKYRGKS